MASRSAPRRVRASAAFGSEAEVLPAGSARWPQYSYPPTKRHDPGQAWRDGEHIEAGDVEVRLERRGTGPKSSPPPLGGPAELGRRSRRAGRPLTSAVL